MRIRFFGHFIHLPVIGLALVEALAFCLALYAGALLRLGLDLEPGQEGALWPRALVFGAVISTSFLSLGLYTSRQRARALGLGLRIILAMLASLAIIALVFYIFPALEMGRGVIALAMLIATVASVTVRLVFARVTDSQAMKKRVLVYGQSGQMQMFTRMRRRSDRAGYHLVGVVHHPGDPPDAFGETEFDAARGLRTLCSELEIDELVVALHDRRAGLPMKELLLCRLSGVNVVEFITFMERETGRIQLDLLNPSWIIFGDGFRRGGLRLFTARALDFLASLILLAVASPFMLLAMLAIWLEDGRKGAPIFYRQSRVGYEGRVFDLIKFRSMSVGAEVDGVAQWAQKNDPRVTRVGAFIRKTRIDELPQLLNVLQGRMGFVGPRPERPQFVAELEGKIPYYTYRHSIKPGITGWAQLCYPYGSSVEDATQKLQYDLYYVKHHSLLFDLAILLQTVEVVCMGKGAR